MTTNPILPGFHPDPSIICVGDTFYVATSTFEWYPGVEISRSTDLKNWEIAARPLDREALLDMRGNPDSCGIYAPALSYSDGLFWLVYTDVKRYDGNYKDCMNYLTWAPSIEGPWSDPVFMNASGFDPSLFHDEDGRKWFVNMDWDYRGADSPRRSGFFGGIVLQEYDHAARKLVGPVSRIFEGSELGCTEAPHLLRHDGRYYLCTAEGGTGYNHAITYARADAIEGPYELQPDGPLLTAAHTPDAPLQRTGHGQLVQAPDGQYWHTFLCSRPLPGTRRSPMGRESGIVRCHWRDDGWLECEDPNLSVHADGYAPDAVDYKFDQTLSPDFLWLRSPLVDRLMSLTDRPGHLRLIGRESIGSWFEQSLFARRQTGWRYTAETSVEFTPRDYQTQAGLVAYYNRHQFHYLFISTHDDGTPLLAIQSCNGDWPEARLSRPVGDGIALPEGPIELGVDVDLTELRFRWRQPGGEWAFIGPVLDASILSDEAGRGEHANFTGAFVGMAAQDNGGEGLHADFAHFSYRNRKG